MPASTTDAVTPASPTTRRSRRPGVPFWAQVFIGLVLGVVLGFVARQFDQAWREMLNAHDRRGVTEVPNGCRFVLRDRQVCPPAAIVRFRDFPEALRHHLRGNGYIAL